MKLANKKYNSYNIFYSKIVNIINAKKEDIPEEDRIYLQDIKGIRVGDSPHVFYYFYNNREYYFTAQNALFSIDINGYITWYYGDWIDGFFRNGTWVDGVWHDGTWCNGDWLGGDWINGTWYKGTIDGSPSNTNP